MSSAVATRRVAPRSTKTQKQRSFRQATSYRDGRKVKSSRQVRATEKGRFATILLVSVGHSAFRECRNRISV
jgi:hypothetical protein